MSRNLLVLIHDYPYNIGEPFFETEIDYLSKSFDNVYVFSTMGKRKEIPTRKYPSNVKCFPLECNHNWVKNSIMGLFSTDNYFNLKNKHWKRKIMAAYLLGRNASIYKKVVKLINLNNIEITNIAVYCYWLTLGVAGAKLSNWVLKQKGYKPRYISRCHGYDVYSEIMPCNYQPFQYEVIKELDNVCPCSNYGTKYLKNKYSLFDGKIITARLGTRDFGTNMNQNDSNKYVFVTCSGLRGVKRLDLFAKAFSIIAKNNKKIEWLCIGDGEDKEKIVDILNKNDVYNQCNFVGNIPITKVYELYSGGQLYCFVNVSSSEGIPVSIMEAISFGLPVIATNVGGNNEIVDSKNGFLLESNPTENDIVCAMKKIIMLNREDYNSLKSESRKKWLELYSANNNYSKWCSFLRGDKNA